jgi:peptidoglycan/LPS O-acetylase OafA/YrhL
MTDTATNSAEVHGPDSLDESGTAPGDRRFRPDVQGLRAVAVVVVVLFHAGWGRLGGGYVGVDVFFVISGFVITGVLLRERSSTDRTSILAFYGRRCRRIIPAATLVILVTVTLAYLTLGVVYGGQTAIDGRWAAVFLANFHFASEGTNYLSAQQPPSLLQNFWSLAVEEQFYLVYPTFFVLLAAVPSKISLRARLAVGLSVVIVVSFIISVVQTGSSPTVAFFSPLTRAWELALGALLAVSTEWLLRIPARVGSLLTWVGLGAIGFAAVAYTATTPYPGSLVAVPVLGTALVIAGGSAVPRGGAESLLRLPPFQWLGKLSYSIYLWHWPILIIAAEAAGRTSLPFKQNLVWLLVALAASVATFTLIENPARHARFLTARRWVPVALGLALIAASLGVVTIQLNAHQVSGSQVVPGAGGSSSTGVEKLVREAPRINSLPSDLVPPLADAATNWGGPPAACWPPLGQTSIPACVFGDPDGSKTMVLYGDSHAGMWFDALDDIAIKAHWKLVYLGKGACPANLLPFKNPAGWGRSGGEYAACDQWHRFAIQRINQVHPDLVVVTQEYAPPPGGSRSYTPRQWQQGLEDVFRQLQVPTSRIVVLGNIPLLPFAGPQCLSRHGADIQVCSGLVTSYLTKYNQAEMSAARTSGAHYLDVAPWFCSTVCTAVVGRYQIYLDRGHVGKAYTLFLEGVLAQALHLSASP